MLIGNGGSKSGFAVNQMHGIPGFFCIYLEIMHLSINEIHIIGAQSKSKKKKTTSEI